MNTSYFRRKIYVRLSFCPICARFTFNVQRVMEGSIPLKWVLWHVTFFLQEYTFYLLIVRYMLSDKIKGKSALKARTFLHVVRDKVHAIFGYRLSVHLSTETVQATCSVFKYFLNPSLANFYL